MDFYNCPYVVVIPFRSGNEYDEDYRCGATGKSCQCCQCKLTPVECEQLFRNRKLAFPREPEEGKIMTVRDAIEGFEIDNALLTGKEDGTVERNIMAIEALEAMDNYRWIPVDERAPKTSGAMQEDEKLLVLLPDGMRTVSFYISTSSGQKIFFDGWDTYNPIAWMPLPDNQN